MEQEFIQCPRCQSKAITYRSGWMFALAALFMGSCSFWLGLIFFPIWLITLLCFIAMPFLFFVKKYYICMHCKYGFRIEKNKPKQPGV
jgi:DNA-directed RNA polymerase subunit RPC12/RpoP